MIRYDSSDIIDTLFRLEGSVLHQIYPHMIATACIGIISSILYDAGKLDDKYGDDELFSLLGMSLGFLLVFRSNTCNDRYQEGLTHIGMAMYHIRDLAFKVDAALRYSPTHSYTAEEINTVSKNYQLKITRWCITYFHLLRLQLRKEKPSTESMNLKLYEGELFLGDESVPLSAAEIEELNRQKSNLPLLPISWMQNAVRRLQSMELISEQQRDDMAFNLYGLVGSFNGSMKIRSNPVPFPYLQMLLLFTTIYCYSVPVLFAEVYGWASALPSAMISFALFGVKAIGDEIEDPYGHDANDLPLEEMMMDIIGDLELILSNQTESFEDLHKDEGLICPNARQILARIHHGSLPHDATGAFSLEVGTN
eukprot:Rmarinus@m.17902